MAYYTYLVRIRWADRTLVRQKKKKENKEKKEKAICRQKLTEPVWYSVLHCTRVLLSVSVSLSLSLSPLSFVSQTHTRPITYNIYIVIYTNNAYKILCVTHVV